MIDEQDAAATLSGKRGAEHSGSSRPDDDRIKGAWSHHDGALGGSEEYPQWAARSGSASDGNLIAGTGDFNGDNRDDIIWRRDDGAFTRWLGQATGGFVSNDANAWTMLPNSWQVAAVGDFDGDNRDDIAWRHDNGAFTTWRGQSNGGFVSNDASAFQMLPNSWQVHLGGDQLV